jgi:hypothetical protein
MVFKRGWPSCPSVKPIISFALQSLLILGQQVLSGVTFAESDKVNSCCSPFKLVWKHVEACPQQWFSKHNTNLYVKHLANVFAQSHSGVSNADQHWSKSLWRAIYVWHTCVYALSTNTYITTACITTAACRQQFLQTQL